MRKPRTLRELAEHPFVRAVSDERSCDQGVWVYLRYPYYNPYMDCRLIHEDTVKECLLQFAEVYSDPEFEKVP